MLFKLKAIIFFTMLYPVIIFLAYNENLKHHHSWCYEQIKLFILKLTSQIKYKTYKKFLKYDLVLYG